MLSAALAAAPILTEAHFARAAWDQYQLPFTIVRPFNCVGIGESRAVRGGDVSSGDIKLASPICGRETQVVRCDRLIVESTFGLPIYRFLSREDACGRIVNTALECLADGVTPVFIGYALGRGQEVVHTLCKAGIPTAVHGSIARLIPVYQQAGYEFCGWEPYAARATEGKALVVVPNFRAILEASGKKTRLAYVSGWAALDNARARVGAPAAVLARLAHAHAPVPTPAASRDSVTEGSPRATAVFLVTEVLVPSAARGCR